MNTVAASNPAAGSGAGGPNVKPEPALGAAALGRVVAAAKAAHEEHQRSAEDQRAVCDLCEVRRADLRGPCGHKYHARESKGESCYHICRGSIDYRASLRPWEEVVVVVVAVRRTVIMQYSTTVVVVVETLFFVAANRKSLEGKYKRMLLVACFVPSVWF